MTVDKIILGIDPGTQLMGYGIIKITNKKIDLLSMGSIELKKFSNHNLRLKRIAERIHSLISDFNPDECAIEAPFMGNNAQSMLKLGRAQGVAMAMSLINDVPITEYAPRKIKQIVTGRGASSKEQVANIVQKVFKISTLPKHLDATDGLATALCHHLCTVNPNLKHKDSMSKNKLTNSSSQKKTWENFVKKNPKRVLGS